MNEFEGRLDESLAQYRRRREELGAVQRGMAELAVTKVAPRKVVSVTVGGAGEVKEISFPTTAYKNLSQAELGSILTKTVAEAREAAIDRAAELIAPMMPPGLDPRQVMRGRADLDQVMPENPDHSVFRLGREGTDSITFG